jgi:hypothetical protein
MAPTNAELQRVAEEAIAAAEAATAQAQSAIARADVATAPVEAADQRVAELENTEQAQLHAHAIHHSEQHQADDSPRPRADVHVLQSLALALPQHVTKYGLDCLVLTDDDFSTDPHWHP